MLTATSLGRARLRGGGPLPDANRPPPGDLASVVRLVSATIVIGAACGAVIGGLGGRLAMRVLFLTSDDRVDSITSDDGFEIGQATLAGSAALVTVTALLGVLAALLYLVARPFLPVRASTAVPIMAVFYAVVGGALIVHPEGVDFTRLEPPLLAIALFVALCAGFGAAVTALVEAAAAAPERVRRRGLVAVPLVVLVFPPALAVALAAAIVHLGAAPTTWWWRSLRVVALLVMTAVYVLSAVELAGDVATLT